MPLSFGNTTDHDVIQNNLNVRLTIADEYYTLVHAISRVHHRRIYVYLYTVQLVDQYLFPRVSAVFTLR